MKKIYFYWNSFMTLIYPNRCFICDEVQSHEEKNHCCPTCLPLKKWLTVHVCTKCGKPLELIRDTVCRDCSKRTHFYNQGRAMWVYDGAIKKMLHRYKYQKRKQLGKVLGEEMYAFYQSVSYHEGSRWPIDLITCVPLHENRLKERTFNQSAIIADILGMRLGKTVLPNLLIRIKNTKPQKDLTDTERIFNVNGAFCLSNTVSCRGKNVLIVDDIYTTGNTINECAKILKRYGANNIYFLTVAIGKGF